MSTIRPSVSARAFPLVAVVTLLALLSAVAAAPAFAQRRPSKVAVLVGIEKYRSGRGLEPLRFTVDDAQKLGAVLKRYGFAVVTLTDSDATKADVMDTLAQLGSAYELEGIGTAVFFFSGHGFSMNGEHYLAAYDTRGDDLAGTALRVKDVEAALTKSGAVQRMLWIDACRSSATRGAEEQRSFSRIMLGEGTALLLSTRYGEVSRESPELGNGVFTHFLVRGLSGEAGHGPLRFLQLADWLIENMRTWTLQQGILQVPYIAGENANILIGSLDGDVEASPAPGAPTRPASPPAPARGGPVEPGSITLRGPFRVLLEKTDRVRDQKFLQFPDVDGLAEYLQDDPLWKNGIYSITSLAYGNNGLLAVLSDQGNPDQTYKYAKDFPKEYVTEKWDQGFRITELGALEDDWFVVMSKDSGIGIQSWKTSKEWPADFVKEKWGAGQYLTQARWRDGTFAVIMSRLEDGRLAEQRWHRGWDEDWDRKNRDEGFVLSLIVPSSGESIYVMNRYATPYDGWSLGNAEQFPAADLAAQLAKGYRVVFVY